MTEATHPNSWAVTRFHLLSHQFIEAYRAYSTRPAVAKYRADARAGGHWSPPEEVEVFLLYHALELAMKGWLLFSVPGMTPEQLKKDYSHTLPKLARAVEPYYPDVRKYLPLLELLDRSKYVYPDISDDGILVPSEMEEFAEFASNCGWALFNALGQENARLQAQL